VGELGPSTVDVKKREADVKTQISREDSILVLRALVDVIVETARESKDELCGGVPEGLLYAALMERGLSYDSYMKLIELAIATGRVKRTHGQIVAVD
jgi:hypothetical protein